MWCGRSGKVDAIRDRVACRAALAPGARAEVAGAVAGRAAFSAIGRLALVRSLALRPSVRVVPPSMVPVACVARVSAGGEPLPLIRGWSRWGCDSTRLSDSQPPPCTSRACAVRASRELRPPVREAPAVELIGGLNPRARSDAALSVGSSRVPGLLACRGLRVTGHQGNRTVGDRHGQRLTRRRCCDGSRQVQAAEPMVTALPRTSAG